MAMHIALLRAINVGGRNKIAMADLRGMFDALGLAGAKTILQSGNVVFARGKQKAEALEKFLEAETQKRFDVSADFIVRTAEEWEKIVARNPFPKEAKSDPSHLVVMCLKGTAQTKDVKALQAAIKGPEIVRGDGRQLYITYPAGIGTSKLTITVIERMIGTRGTARNWNTVLKLAALTTQSSGPE